MLSQVVSPVSQFSRICVGLAAFVALLVCVQVLWADGTSAAGPCEPPVNAIVCENSKTGNPAEEWDVSGAGDPSIQGFTTDISVNHGQTARFKIKTSSTKYRLDIYRMGYYGGDGARKVATVQPSAKLPQTQPECKTESSTGLIDCGNWAESASWAVPSTAVSGIYFAKLVREDKTSEGSHILFIVRDDGGHEDLLFQTADETWQAYNRYGGNSLYFGGPATNPERAYKVSYNRPFETRGPSPEDMPFSAEYPMVRWLERNGYDVGYFTGIDADRRGSEILNHKVYLDAGHDEYWSGTQRTNLEAARNAGVNLAFFSGNEIFWKTRWANSIDGSNTDHRTLVCYKETHANAKIDPESKIWTGTWRDPRFSPPADGGRPENALSGQIFTVNSGTAAIEVPAAQGKMRLWRDTSVAELAPGKTATLAPKTLGYEWDEDVDNGSRPPGLADLSSTTVNVPEHILDYGSNYGPATATHHLTLYRASSGALVFGAGTVQWSWGLDPVHDRVGPEEADPRMQQATVNLFADMGVQAKTLQGELHAETKSTDTKAPTTTITSPLDNAQLESGKPVTVTGTATDAEGQTGGGRIAGVEVSTDGGTRWHPASGLEQWTYKWTPGATGSATVMARAVDDSANLEKPGDQAPVQVIPHTCPCSIWDESVSGSQDPEENPIELGVKFRADTSGYITGLRFYKTGGNSGKHVGRLWTAGGTQLAQATFFSETQSGWQEISFDSPVPISANTTYIASYFAPHGHYAAISDYFSLVGTDSAPLHALAEGVSGANGIFRLGGEGQLFEGGGPESFRSANYLVDVVFQKEVVPDTTPPQVSATSPVAGAAEVDPSVAISATFNEPMRASSFGASAFEMHDGLGEQVAGSFSFNGPKRTLEFSPSDTLRHSTTYTATIKGGAGGVADVAGNTLASNFTWSFTTTAAPPPPPDEGPGGPILVIANSPNPFSRYYAEILRAEGLNEYRVVDISSVTAATLASYDVAILGEGSLSGPQAQMMTSWVESGGNLIAMRPSQKLAALLGLTSAGGTLSNAYMKVDTSTSSGTGIVGETIQFHGTADRYTTSGAQTIATLYPEAEGAASSNPAVTLRSVGSNGGQAAAFSYDLARSVVYTRQGNRAWAGQERDGSEPVRSDDLFFGAKAGSEEPDWVDLNRSEIPQADEQQRLLTNLIERMNADRKPLPRFWFLPRDGKAAVVLTGDDHGVGGTVGRFQRYEEESPSGCVVSKWECIRATSYIFPETPITDAEAAAFNAAGFEISLQGFTDCSDWNSATELKSLYSGQLATFAANFPSLPPPATERNHCVVWSDWASQPKVESETGIRLDTNYYYWPASWAGDHPGMFTGSGMPMRFADADGSTIDAYQAPTQLTDESGQDYPSTINTLLDNALGSKGYYGVFTADMHNDEAASPEAEDIVESAKSRHVPVVSAQQMLTWLDGRNQSSFGSIGWNGSKLSFTIAPAEGATGLRAMLPIESSAGALFSLTREGKAVTTKTEKIKGIEYAFFDATAGSYAATYGAELSSTVPASPANNNSPKVFGSAPSGSTVRIYKGADCSGSAIATVTSTQLAAGVTVSVSDNTTTQFRVTATLTKTSPCSAPLTYVEDSSAPSAQVDAHPTAVTNSSAAKFEFSGNDGSGSGVASFECRRDAGAWGACTSPQSYSGLTDGAHSFEVKAIDKAGNVGSAVAFGWSVDTTAPTTTTGGHPATPSGSAEAKFEFTGSDGSGSGIASLECRIDSSQAADWGVCTSPKTYGSLADGSHTFEARAIDKAGNTGAPASFGWTIDTVAPLVTVDSVSKTLLGSGQSSEVRWHANENGTFQLRVAGSNCTDGTILESGSYGSQPAQHTSIVSATDLAEGANTLRICVTDAASNRGSISAALSKDTAAPTTTIETHPQALSNSASAEFTFSGNDGSGSGIASFECRRDSTETSAWASCSSPKNYASLTDGEHSFQARAIDKAANVGSPATFSWTIDTVSPTTTIDTGPASLTNDSTPSFDFHSNEPGSAFECSIDSGTPAYGACSGAGTHTPASALSDGPHTFRVRATDAAKNQGAAATRDFTVDTAIPTAPNLSSTQPASPANNNSPKIIGSAPAGSTVRLYQGAGCQGSPLNTVPAAQLTTGITVSVSDDSTTTFSATATSAAQNTSPCSAPLTYVEDSSAPTAQIQLHPPALSNSASAKFEFSANDGSGSGIASLECRIDSSQAADWGTCTSPKTYSSLTDGAHTFETRAVDKAGNTGSPISFGWTVDTTAPTLSVDSLSRNLLGPGHSTEIHWHADENGAFELRVGGSDCTSGTVVESGSYSSQPNQHTSVVSVADLTEGANTLRLCLTDAASNRSSAVASVSRDTIEPTTSIDSSPQALSSSAEAQFGFSGADSGSGVAAYECRRDGGAWGGCTSPLSYQSLGDGPHAFETRAVDQAGNTDASPASFSWSVDTTAPVTAIDSGPNGLTNSASAKFEFSASDGSGSGVASFECRIDSSQAADWGICTSPQNYSSLADGPHAFEVRAIDDAGNVGVPASASWTVDTAAPDPPNLSATVPASPANDNSPKVIGSAPADTTVRLYATANCSGSPLATASASELEGGVTLSVADDTSTKIRATATSSAGNTSGCSAPLTYVEDSTAPEAQIDGHPAGLVNSALATFVFSASDGSGSGLASFECRIDSSQAADWSTCTSPKTYTGLGNGTHTFEVRAVDQAGNTGSAKTSGWTVDTTAPTTTIDSHPATVANSASAEFTFSGSDGSGSGVASFECHKDSDAWAPCTSPKSYAALAVGSHNFDVRAVDEAGNPDGTPASFDWEVDTAAPNVPNLSSTQPASPANNNSPKIIGSAPAGSTVRLYQGAGCQGSPLNTVPTAQLTTGITVSVSDDSTTTFSATATSAAQNTSPCSAPLTYVEDSSAPQSQIEAAPASVDVSHTADFLFSASDGSGAGIASFECRLDSSQESDWEPCTSPATYGSLADGAHSFEVRALDRAGNADATPARFNWTVETEAEGSPATPGDSSTGGASTESNKAVSIQLQQVKYNPHSGRALLIFKVSAAGKLSVSVPDTSGSRRTQARRWRRTSVNVSQPGLARLPIKLSPAGRQLLLENRKVRVRVKVGFESPGGTPVSKELTILLTYKAGAEPRSR